MPDASFDAVIIGGGTKSSITAMYLAAYGGMSVGVFERLNEMGGGCADEEAAPGFVNNTHATLSSWTYYEVIKQDFPDYEDLGGRWDQADVAMAGVYPDGTALGIYSRKADPTQEKTAREVARFSERDAEAWLRLWDAWDKRLLPAYMETFFNPPPAFGVPDPFTKAVLDPRTGIDPHTASMTPAQASRVFWESPELQVMTIRMMLGSGIYADDSYMGIPALLAFVRILDHGAWVGGTHSLCHANVATLLQHGVKTFLNCEVEKIIVENGVAKGIRLKDGSEIEAKKLIVSGVDPRQLYVQLIGKEHVAHNLLRKLAVLEDKRICLMWHNWGLAERPLYKAGSFFPDLNARSTQAIMLFHGGRDVSFLEREAGMRKMGQIPDKPTLLVCEQATYDKTYVPRDEYWQCLTEGYAVAAYELPERKWLQYSRDYSEYCVRTWEEYTTNVTWDKVIGCFPYSPYHIAQRLKNMAPAGNWAVIDRIPSQMGSNRPLPELSMNRTPIKNLYGTGIGYGFSYGSSADQGYACYKVIAEDLGLRKSWEEKGRPF